MGQSRQGNGDQRGGPIADRSHLLNHLDVVLLGSGTSSYGSIHREYLLYSRPGGVARTAKYGWCVCGSQDQGILP